jgi:hypothetical protein
VTTMTTPNLYGAIITLERDIKRTDITPIQRQNDLKYIIHLIGDAHQPMHVSRAIDRGGNLIAVEYMHHKTNFHSVWDGQLLKSDNPDFTALSGKMICLNGFTKAINSVPNFTRK